MSFSEWQVCKSQFWRGLAVYDNWYRTAWWSYASRTGVRRLFSCSGSLQENSFFYIEWCI